MDDRQVDPRERPAPPHGTRGRYQLRRSPCRCPACRQANTAYMRRWRGHPAHRIETLRLWPDVGL